MTPQDRLRAQARIHRQKAQSKAHLRALYRSAAESGDPDDVAPPIVIAIHLVGADLVEFGADLLDALHALERAVEKAAR